MGFRQGDGNEALLTCQICGASLPLTALFCGGCGSNRNTAITGFRTDSLQTTTRGTSSIERVGDGLSNTADSVNKSLKRFGGVLATVWKRLLALMAGSLKIAIVITILIGLAFGYKQVQASIYENSISAVSYSDYLEYVATRDVSALVDRPDLFPNPNNVEMMPGYFQVWDGVENLKWNIEEEWDFGSGFGEVTIRPSGSNRNFSITLQFEGEKKSSMGIFRTLDWKVTTPVSTITLDTSGAPITFLEINGKRVQSPFSLALFQKPLGVLPGKFVIRVQTNRMSSPRTYVTEVGAGDDIRHRIR